MKFADKIRNAQLGKTHLFSVGQAGFIVKSAKGQLLGIDLYLSDCVERLEGHIGFKRLLPKILEADELEFDYIIATHLHYDHFDIDAIPDLMKNNKTKLFASVNCEKEIKNLQINSSRIAYVKPNESYVAGNFLLEFILCDHGQSAPDAVGVVITVDGKKICEVGDTCMHFDWMDMYNEKGPLDVLIAPINGAYGNLNENECAKLSASLNPRLTVPCHYGMFASHGGNIKVFYEIMSEKYPDNRIMLMAPGDGIVL